jgi:hypothetical protein
MVRSFTAIPTCVIGATLEELLAGAGHAVWADLMGNTENRSAQVETRLRRHDGSEIPLALQLNVLPARRFSLLVTDLSRQKQFEELAVSREALRQSDSAAHKLLHILRRE